MAIVDRCGLPLSIGTHSAQRHEAKLVQLSLDLVLLDDLPENLVGDKAYDSDPLDAEVKRRGVEMIAPHRRNRTRPKTQDGRRRRRYKRRWIVERFFAWLQWNRRVLIRWEYITSRTSSDSFNSRPYACCSSRFIIEIGSTYGLSQS